MATGEWGPNVGQSRVFRATIKWVQSGQRCSCSFHLRDMGVAGQTPQDVANAVDAMVQTPAWRAPWSNLDSFESVDVVNLSSAEGHTIAYPNLKGTADVNIEPSFSAVVVNLIGGLRRRYANGRFFLPVRGSIDRTADQLSPGGVTKINGALAELQTRFMDDGLTAELRLVHLHGAKPARQTKKGAQLPAVPASWYDVTAIKVNRAITPLRSRKVGVGS